MLPERSDQADRNGQFEVGEDLVELFSGGAVSGKTSRAAATNASVGRASAACSGRVGCAVMEPLVEREPVNPACEVLRRFFEGLMPDVRELSPGETALAFEAMRELRPHIGSLDMFVHRVNRVQRPEGYRLIASFEGDQEAAAAVAGFRTGHNLAWGRFLYVDDLVTRGAVRGSGHGAALFGWLVAQAVRLECDEVHLDSGVQRHDAHRFYLVQGMRISGHHFMKEVGRRLSPNRA